MTRGRAADARYLSKQLRIRGPVAPKLASMRDLPITAR